MSCVPAPQVRVPPLSTHQLWSLVLALTLGLRKACQQCDVTLFSLCSWLAHLWVGPKPWVIKRQGFPRGVWPWKTGQLAQWLLVQREQQRLGSPEVLLPVAQTLLGARSPLNHHLAWTAYFLLRHDLALDPLEALEPLEAQSPSKTPDLDRQQPLRRGRLPKTVLDRSRAFIHLLNAEVGLARTNHRSACSPPLVRSITWWPPTGTRPLQH